MAVEHQALFQNLVVTVYIKILKDAKRVYGDNNDPYDSGVNVYDENYDNYDNDVKVETEDSGLYERDFDGENIL